MTLANLGISSLISKLSSNINDKLTPSLVDPLGSACLTPPGGDATPFPNPIDNRLPGISHSSFGQVRPTFCSRHKSALPALGQQVRSSPLSRQSLLPSGSVGGGNGGPENISARSPSSSDSSPHSHGEFRDVRKNDYFDTPPLLPHEHFHAPNCLTPPTSPSAASSPSASSVNVLAGNASGVEKTAPPPQPAGSKAAAPTDQRHDQVTAKRESGMPTSGQRGVLGRRHTYAAYAQLSSMLTAPTVATAQLSNPAISHLTAASRPRSGSQSAHELRKLTDSGRGRCVDQNTPPYSPRSRSQGETVAKAVKSPDAPTSTPAPASNVTTQSSSTDGSGPLPPKGKLSVLISEGRNLRASVDPYVVCQFQRSEYISKGPINTAAAESNRRKLKGGAAMKRTDSESGRPLAIPMKSRQSSNTSAGDSRDPTSDESGKMTDPKWEHRATL